MRCPTKRLLLKPCLIQLIIHPLIRQQLGVRSLLDDLPIVNDHDLIRIRDGRKAVRDHKGCALSNSMELYVSSKVSPAPVNIKYDRLIKKGLPSREVPL